MHYPSPMKKDSNAWGYWFGLAALIAAVIVFGICGIVALAKVNSLTGNLQIIQFNIVMEPGKVWEQTGEANGLAKGSIQVDYNSGVLTYNFFIAGVGTPTQIAIYGPVTSNNAKTASQFLPSDGSSLSTTVTGGGNHPFS
jgi:hypothetical protein